MSRPPLEVADLIRSAGAAFIERNRQWTLRGKQVSPHVLRHTCAMIVLQATKDIRKVSLWLGHSDLTTTEVYVRADPTEKLEAIEAVVPPSLRKGKFRPPDKLLALLKAKP
jgi:integrase/recombinase XerD